MKVIKKIPILRAIYRMVRKKYTVYRLNSQPVEKVFTDIYTTNAWGSEDTASGTGSDTVQTKVIAKVLPKILREYGVSTMLDIPCGDFHWMKNVDLDGVDYTGADIVNDLIESNRKKYERDGLSFYKLDLTRDELPTVDLVFSRDCLVHLSFKDVYRALDNICKSQSTYLLTTTFADRTKNKDIATGQWRTLNLEISPFSFPKQLAIINEGCTERDGYYSDKSLALWRTSDIRKCIE